MTQYLPPNLLALFTAREPIKYLPPADKLTHEKKRLPYTGLSEFMENFEHPDETPPPVKPLTKQEKLDRKRREKAEQNAYKLEQDLAFWNPNENPNATGDPYKTLFVARINYNTSESKLRREFEAYGKIKQIKLVHDTKSGKPRGYAFIEYENKADMLAAYKRADGKKIDDRRVLVDYERGRTIGGWKPRRLGGGKGGRKSHLPPDLLTNTLTSSTSTTALNSNNGNDSIKRSGSDNEDVKRTGSRERDRDRGDRSERSNKDRDRERGGDRDKDRDRERDRSDRGDRDKDRERKRSKEREKRSRSRSKDKEREKDKERRKRSSSKDHHRRSKSKERSKKIKREARSSERISTTAVPAN